MNDPTPLPGQPPGETGEAAADAQATAAAERAVGNFGAALRAAREAAGISVPTLAGRLRLHVRQIEALERSDLAELPTLIYVRGFVRSCARELRIDAAPLLEDLDRRAGVVPGTPLAPAGGTFHLARLGDGSRTIVAGALAVLVIAGVIGTLWPRRASVPPGAAIVVSPSPPPAAPAAAPPPERAAGEPVPPAASAAPAAAAASNTTAAPAPAPAHPAVPALAPRPSVSKAAPGHPGDAPAAAVAADATATTVAAPEPPPPAPPPATDALVLHVHAPSWVEVVQANGTSVFSQICPAGSVQTVHGTPPLRIVIGNAAAVEAQYRGAAVDLNHYSNANGVARLTLP